MRALWVSLLLVLVGAPALARHHANDTDSDSAPGEFDYYLLSLSWSPAYCLIHPEDRSQCDRMGLGFVLHGLWPQDDSGGYPERCESGEELSPEALTVGTTLYPTARLMRHEWQSHGTCSGLSAVEYFRTADRALAALQIPAVFDAPDHVRSMSRAEIAAAFAAANPAMPAGALAIDCSRGQLSEVRLCLTRALAPRRCGHGIRGSCADGPILIQSSRE
jgi:ribonuclease T2